jgi:hypothetical protein
VSRRHHQGARPAGLRAAARDAGQSASSSADLPRARDAASGILDLQRLVGNRAVADALGATPPLGLVASVGRVVATIAKEPPEGIRDIRARSPGGTLGRTVTSLSSGPPILRPRSTRVDDGWVCRAQEVRVREPDFLVQYPAPGPHRLAPIRILDVTPEWSDTIHEGEKEHVEDGQLAWARTWGRVRDVVAGLAAEPGAAFPTEDEARQDLWRRFLARLPAYLRPASATWSEDAQVRVWGLEGDTVFRRLMKATELRDAAANGWHLPDVVPVRVTRKREVHRLERGRSRIREVPSSELLDSVMPGG